MKLVAQMNGRCPSSGQSILAKEDVEVMGSRRAMLEVAWLWAGLSSGSHAVQSGARRGSGYRRNGWAPQTPDSRCGNAVISNDASRSGTFHVPGGVLGAPRVWIGFILTTIF